MSAATLNIEKSPANPEPEEQPSMDDLVAQQAGEDIDKLLQQAHLERPGTEPTVEGVSRATAAGAGGADEETLTGASAHAGAAESTVNAKPPGDVPAASSREPSQTRAQTATGSPGNARNKPAGGPHRESADHDPADVDEVEGAQTCEPLPACFRPLEWINQPFAGISEATRTTLGFAAIITLFNAVATIVYVMRFRHQH